jgi:deoxyribodipyrimidine photolyase-related protein
MNKTFLILPISLIKDLSFLKKYEKIIVYEHPEYFKSNYNFIKLVYQKQCLDNYYSLLKKKFGNKVSFIPFYQKLNNINNVDCFDPVDYNVINHLKKYIKNINFIDSNIFIFNHQDLNEYLITQKNNKRKYLQTSFYSWGRKKMDILMQNGKPTGNKLTYDTLNRNKLKPNVKIPKIKTYKNNFDKSIKYIKDNIKNDNYNDIIFPTTHSQANKWLNEFVKYRLHSFGEYQDAITKDTKQIILFHSGIAPLLNIGLLTPLDVINTILKNSKGIDINNIEGFIRQILGWREQCRLLYHFEYNKIKNSNFFNHQRKLNDKWYQGNTGIKPVDDCIIKAFNNGYLHHIERLMIIGNFMLLCQIHPHEVYRWFMEFSLDSYDWVMLYNVYSMSQYADGGFTTTKPYISSSNYIVKMSDYKPDGSWDYIWDCLYWNFIHNNSDKIKNVGRMSFQVSIWNKKNLNEKNNIIKTANDFILQITN